MIIFIQENAFENVVILVMGDELMTLVLGVMTEYLAHTGLVSYA